MSWSKPDSKLGKQLRRGFQIASDIIPKLPTRSDSLLTKGVKILGIVDSFYKIGRVEKHALRDFLDRINAEDMTNAQFVDLFYSTTLRTLFEVDRLWLDGSTSILIATRKDIGTLYFIEWNYGSKHEPANDFFFSPGFNFVGMLDLLWEHYDGRMYIAMVKDGYQVKTQYSPIPKITDPLLGTANARLKRLATRHIRYQRDKIQRTYLFVGDAGTGKSTMALRMAQLAGTRTLQIDSTALSHVGQKEMSWLIDSLKPDFIIFDDIDKVNMEQGLPTILLVLSNMKRLYPEVGIILTVNKPEALHATMLRPERIDEVEKFYSTTEDTEVIFRGYIDEFKADVSADDVSRILSASHDYSAIWMREIALRLRYDTVDEVLDSVAVLRELSLAAAAEKKDSPPSKKDTPNGPV